MDRVECWAPMTLYPPADILLGFLSTILTALDRLADVIRIVNTERYMLRYVHLVSRKTEAAYNTTRLCHSDLCKGVSQIYAAQSVRRLSWYVVR